MLINYLGMACLAAFAVAITVYADTGSLLLGFLAYSATGTLVLIGVLVSALLADRVERSDETGAIYPAE